MLSFHNNHFYLCTKASFLHCMHSCLCYFFCYSHYYKGFSMPSNSTIRVNLESFNQIIKLNIKSQLKMKRFQFTFFFFLIEHDESIFIILFPPTYSGPAVWLQWYSHNYRSRLKLDQIPGISEILFHVFSSDQLLYRTANSQFTLLLSSKTSKTSQRIATTYTFFIPCQFFIFN